MKNPKTLYILIGIFCIFAIIAGIYAQFIEGSSDNLTDRQDKDPIDVGQDSAVVQEEFNSLFTNQMYLNNIDVTGIPKIKEDKEIVYSAYSISRNELAYELNINIPVINIKNEVANSFNAITQANFVNKANDILKKTDISSKTIYNIDYVGYINGDILSVVIKSTLKEGQSAQRVIVQTYNYNLVTNSIVTLNDVITSKTLNKEDVNNKIKKVVQAADNEAKAIQNMGYESDFSRNLNSGMYTVDNTGTFFLGENSKLYVIYAYGNNKFTSVMDIVLFE